MKLLCPECASSITANDINLDRMVAKCATCNAVFGFDQNFTNPNVVHTLTRLDTPKPNRIEMQHAGTELIFSWRWFTTSMAALAIFAVIWNGFLAVWFGIAIINRIWFMAAFGSLHALVGITLAYVVISGFINSTAVRVGMGELTIKHGPLPYRRGIRMETGEIIQLYSKEIIQRSSRTTSAAYEIHAATRDGKSIKLVGGLETSEQALYIEQEIERYLRIPDQPIRGEIGR